MKMYVRTSSCISDVDDFLWNWIIVSEQWKNTFKRKRIG
jgi:hypothetical protein